MVESQQPFMIVYGVVSSAFMNAFIHPRNLVFLLDRHNERTNIVARLFIVLGVRSIAQWKCSRLPATAIDLFGRSRQGLHGGHLGRFQIDRFVDAGVQIQARRAANDAGMSDDGKGSRHLSAEEHGSGGKDLHGESLIVCKVKLYIIL
jgi:hypothetical protein